MYYTDFTFRSSETGSRPIHVHLSLVVIKKNVNQLIDDTSNIEDKYI